MNSAIAYEDVLRPELTLPVQFQQIWHGAGPVTPERSLAISVLWQAISDVQKFRYARRRRRQRLYMDAYRWIASNDRSWPYSFVNICEALGFSPEFLRSELLAVASVTEEAA